MYGVIDIGSNTIRLSVYKKTDSSLKLLFSNKNMAGLIAYVDKNGDLSENGIKKIINVLNGYKQILGSVNVIDVYVLATASLRNVNNSNDVINRVHDATGYLIDLISGEEEAVYDFIGATHYINLQDGIMVDIGGGSTELVFYKNRRIEKAISMPIGSLNLYYKHVKDILPTEKELSKIKSTVKNQLKQIDINVDYHVVCGIGGTIRALNKLNNNLYDLPIINRSMEVKNVKEILSIYKEDRSYIMNNIIKYVPDRIHTLIPGMAILITIAKRYNSNSIIVSKHGVKEGYLINKILGE